MLGVAILKCAVSLKQGSTEHHGCKHYKINSIRYQCNNLSQFLHVLVKSYDIHQEAIRAHFGTQLCNNKTIMENPRAPFSVFFSHTMPFICSEWKHRFCNHSLPTEVEHQYGTLLELVNVDCATYNEVLDRLEVHAWQNTNNNSGHIPQKIYTMKQTAMTDSKVTACQDNRRC